MTFMRIGVSLPLIIFPEEEEEQEKGIVQPSLVSSIQRIPDTFLPSSSWIILCKFQSTLYKFKKLSAKQPLKTNDFPCKGTDAC